MPYSIEEIGLELIDRADRYFKITTSSGVDDIRRSIQAIGIINPPILVRGREKHTIISGFRRIEAAEKSGSTRIPARIMPIPKESPACARIAISDNSFQRQLNPVEQARAVQLLQPFCDSTEQLAREASRLMLPGNPSMIDKLQSIHQAGEEIQQYLLSDRLSMTTVLLIQSLDTPDRAPMARFIQALNVSLSVQREIFQLATEIAAREDLDLPDLLSESTFEAILANEEIDTRRKASKIRKLLRTRRYPALSEAEAAYHRKVKQLDLHSSIRLTPPANFEGATYTFQLAFADYASLVRSRDCLNRAVDHPAMRQILE